MICISYDALMYCKIMCRFCDFFWWKDAYSTAEATDNSAKEKNAESGRKSFQTKGQNHHLIVHPDDNVTVTTLSLFAFWSWVLVGRPQQQHQKETAPAWVQGWGGTIKKHRERHRNAKIWTTPQELLLYPWFIPSLTSAVPKQRYTGRRPMWSDQRPSRGKAITCAKEYVLKSRPWIGDTCKCLGMSWHAPIGAGQRLEELEVRDRQHEEGIYYRPM